MEIEIKEMNRRADELRVACKEYLPLVFLRNQCSSREFRNRFMKLKDATLRLASVCFDDVFESVMGEKCDFNLEVSDFINEISRDTTLFGIGMVEYSDIKEVQVDTFIKTENEPLALKITEDALDIVHQERFFQQMMKKAGHLRMRCALYIMEQENYRGEAFLLLYKLINDCFSERKHGYALACTLETELSKGQSDFNFMRVLHALRDYQRA